MPHVQYQSLIRYHIYVLRDVVLLFLFTDEDDGLEWHIRYKIIKGICEGLKYLHEGSENPIIWHLDLKPENILLDNEMMPKIADFGLSRFVCDKATRRTTSPIGTM